ncbi:DUF1992 domain-containing protein [Paenibacillus hexagrammi]|uniref:DUF1992 domain-containing protein n=1 Tax=Paenibacillus hexagrammi TaxID=2908839 RepID=A0ABY3SP94_9BACL|nr:DUF1992 domain-containing protein [Paenibacillus sp. YPD9-1]UJF35771.1 DUF1992 domain-containing protein [Paenibacillus sp. YPD9-1]
MSENQEQEQEHDRNKKHQRVAHSMDELDLIELQKESWADDAYQEFVRNGGLNRLPGMGKPLSVPTGDPLETVLRQANVQPPWVMLRSEIGTSMKKAMTLLRKSPNDSELVLILSDINKLIIELNGLAPSHTLHRVLVSKDNLAEQYERWYRR